MKMGHLTHECDSQEVGDKTRRLLLVKNTKPQLLIFENNGAQMSVLQGKSIGADQPMDLTQRPTKKRTQRASTPNKRNNKLKAK